MSRHEGVSCDSCLKGNFTGKRYKCLVCYDYDLCSACYDAGVASTTRHLAEHPMQCILTRSDFDLYFGGESVSAEQHQSYTCPHCGRMGFTDLLLLEHVSNEHADTTTEVVCPVCAAYPGGEPNHVIDDLAAHLMLEHRTSANELDVQLSGMRAVRRIPHHGRSVANPRTRRAANMQYQPPGSTLMVLSPGDRDREAMDPIAELLSQLSSVRSRTAAAQSVSSQLQQLEMQLHSSSRSSATARLQAERLTAAQAAAMSGIPDPLGRSVTTISFPSTAAAAAAEQQSASAAASSVSSSATSRDRSSFLLARLGDTKKSESEQQNVEMERADKSMFVQELLLALLAEGNDQQKIDYKALLSPAPAVTVTQPAAVSIDSKSAAQQVAAPTLGIAASSVQQQQQNHQQQQSPMQQNALADSTVSVDHPVGTAAVSHVGGGRSNVHTSSSAPSSDGRILPPHSAASLGSRAVSTKRKSAPASNTNKASKEVSSAAGTNAAKRH